MEAERKRNYNGWEKSCHGLGAGNWTRSPEYEFGHQILVYRERTKIFEGPYNDHGFDNNRLVEDKVNNEIVLLWNGQGILITKTSTPRILDQIQQKPKCERWWNIKACFTRNMDVFNQEEILVNEKNIG